MSEIEPGEGYRLLDKKKDTPKEGDEFYYCDSWRKRPYPLHPFSSTETYRRRIPAKPEAIWIDGHLLSLYEGSVLIGCKAAYEYCFPSSTEDIRQLADWLTRYADWREAQDAAK